MRLRHGPAGQRQGGHAAPQERAKGSRLPPTAPVPPALATTRTARVSPAQPEESLGAALVWLVWGEVRRGTLPSVGQCVAPTSSSELWPSRPPVGELLPRPRSEEEKAGRTSKEREGAVQNRRMDGSGRGATAGGPGQMEPALPAWRSGPGKTLWSKGHRPASDGVSASRVPLTPTPGPARAPPPWEPPQATPWGPCFSPDGRNAVSLHPILGGKVC